MADGMSAGIHNAAEIAVKRIGRRDIAFAMVAMAMCGLRIVTSGRMPESGSRLDVHMFVRVIGNILQLLIGEIARGNLGKLSSVNTVMRK